MTSLLSDLVHVGGLSPTTLCGQDIDGTVRAFLRDRVTGGFPVITTDHAFIHEGIAFSYGGNSSVNSAASFNLTFTTPADVAATKTLAMTVATNANITFTAVTAGPEGNSISLAIVNTTVATPVVTVSDYDISVTASVSTTTATVLNAAITAATAAVALVSGVCAGDGSGLVSAHSHTHLAGGSDALYVHFKPASVAAKGGPVTVQFLEKPTVTGAGTTVTGYNRNRISTTTPELVIKTAATVTTASAMLDTIYIPAATQGQQKVGAAAASAEEWVLKQGTTYGLKFVNSSGATNTVAYNLFWYSESNA